MADPGIRGAMADQGILWPWPLARPHRPWLYGPPPKFSWGSSPLGAVQEERALWGTLEAWTLEGARQARTLEGALEERALGCAGEERALGCAGEERALGCPLERTCEEQALESICKPLTLGGALAAQTLGALWQRGAGRDQRERRRAGRDQQRHRKELARSGHRRVLSRSGHRRALSRSGHRRALSWSRFRGPCHPLINNQDPQRHVYLCPWRSVGAAGGATIIAVGGGINIAAAAASSSPRAAEPSSSGGGTIIAAGGGRLMIPGPPSWGTKISRRLLIVSLWVQSSVTVHSGSQERGGEELLSNLYFYLLTQKSLETHYPHKMKLRLDTEAGKHRAYKGETKLDN